MVIVLTVLGAVIVFGLSLHIAIWICFFIFRLVPDKYRNVANFTPGISILKPVRGLNPGDMDNFRSFFKLDYEDYEILFLIHQDAGEDPAVDAINKIIGEFPDVDARIIRTSKHVAVHEKVNNYIEGVENTKYDIVCITDADAYVDPDYLSRDVKPLSDSTVGMVTSVQTMNDFRCAPVAFEGLAQNFDGVMYWIFRNITARLDFVYGHSIFFRKEDFYRLNAIDEVKDHMIDDQAWGITYVHKNNMNIHLSKKTVHTKYTKSTWSRVGGHILRWSMFRKHFAGAATYFLIIFYYMIPWALGALALSFLVSPDVSLFGIPLQLTVQTLALSGLCVRFFSVVISNLLNGDELSDLKYFYLIPLRDFFDIYASIRSYFVKSFEHAGIKYVIENGRMKRVE